MPAGARSPHEILRSERGHGLYGASIAEAVAGLPFTLATLEGEAVVVDEQGHPSLPALLAALGVLEARSRPKASHEAAYCALAMTVAEPVHPLGQHLAILTADARRIVRLIPLQDCAVI